MFMYQIESNTFMSGAIIDKDVGVFGTFRNKKQFCKKVNITNIKIMWESCFDTD